MNHLFKHIRENKFRAFLNNDIITNKEKILHSEEEINFLIEFLNDPTPTKKFFYYLEHISFQTCVYAIWDYKCEQSADDAWFNIARKATKNSLEIVHVSNSIDCYNDYIADSDIDSLLKKAAATGKSIAVVSVPGTVFQNKTALTAVWPYFEKNKDMLLMAHVLDNAERKQDNSYYWSIHPQFFAVNLTKYNELGQPSFSSMTDSEYQIGVRSHDNVHDNYTPLWLRPGGNVVGQQLKTGCGSNLINQALKNNSTVENVPNIIRTNKKFYYPQNADTMDMLETENDLIRGNFHGGWNFVYIFNTEEYPKYLNELCNVTVFKDGKFENRIYDNLDQFVSSHPVDSFANVSSGWAGDWWSYLFKFDQNKICYFDINSASLFYKKMLIEHWPGPKEIMLGDFLYQHGDVENSDMFFNLINLQKPKDLKKWRADLNQYCQQIIDTWGLDEFQSYLNKVKRARQFFVSTDIVHAPKSFENFDLVRKDQFQLIFASNILDNRILFYQNDFNKEKIYNCVINFFNRMPNKTIYVGNNITGLHNSFYDRKTRITNILIKE